MHWQAVFAADLGVTRRIDLIDNTSASWRSAILEQYFLPSDAAVIKCIPLWTRQLDDFWVWHYEKKGCFSVRSAYCMLVATRNRRDELLEGRASSSNAAAEEKCWSSFWSVRVPAKSERSVAPCEALPTNGRCTPPSKYEHR